MNILNTIVQKPNTNIYAARVQDKKETKQNIFVPIDTTNLIKPDRPEKSYIINEPFYMAPINFVTDIKDNLVNIAKATTGKSNDHDLGRINDFSMKAGALALAGYLFAHGKTSLSKSMEFVGFGAFFASMALWPKLFIQAPLKAMYGIDIHQRYMDNEGRKKMFFQDPQYIPWDLYTDEQLSKLGDKLGVPRDIHNRNEIIKKKAHKIALQGNTLWMLTAGFATPLMSALICNGIEKIATPRSEKTSFPNNVFGAFASSIQKMRCDNVDKILKNIDETAAKKLADLDASELNAYLRALDGKDLKTVNIEELLDKMQGSSDLLERKAVKQQILDLIKPTIIVPKADNNYLNEFWDKYTNHKLNDKYQDKWSKLFTKEQIKSLAQENNEPISVQDFYQKLNTYINSVQNDINEGSKYKKALSSIIGQTEPIKQKTITNDFIQKVMRLNRKLYTHSLRLEALDKYQQLYLESVGDSIATYYNNNVQKTFFNVLNYSKEEIEIARKQGIRPIEILQSKLEELVAPPKKSNNGAKVKTDKYEEALRKIHRAILEYDRLFLPDADDGSPQGVKKVCFDLINNFTKKEAQMFEDAGFDKLKKRIIGSNYTNLGSLHPNLLDRTTRRIEELRNGMYKLLYTLDFFRKTSGITKESINDSKFLQTYKNFDFTKYNKLPREYSDEKLLDEIQKLKRIMIEATSADHITKLNYKDRGLYVRAMNLLYSTDFDEATRRALNLVEDETQDINKLGSTTFTKSFKKTINSVLNNLGDFVYDHAENLVLNTNDELSDKNLKRIVGDSGVNDSLLAKRLCDTAKERAAETYNSSKWFKKFGTMSVVLVGVTLLSQIFFGKINKQDLEYIRKDNN